MSLYLGYAYGASLDEAANSGRPSSSVGSRSGYKSNNNADQQYGCALKAGDRVGCFIDLSRGRMHFARSGHEYGVAYAQPTSQLQAPFFPVCCVRNASIEVCFGSSSGAGAEKSAASPRAPFKWLTAAADINVTGNHLDDWLLRASQAANASVVSIDGLTAQTQTVGENGGAPLWQGFKATKGVNGARGGRYYYEAVPLEAKAAGALCRFGWATDYADFDLGADGYGYGYGADREGFGAEGTQGLFVYDNASVEHGEALDRDDVVGCFIDFDEGVVKWTKNGAEAAAPRRFDQTRDIMFPAFALRGNTATVNFGAQPFHFPPDDATWLPVCQADPDVVHTFGNTKAAPSGGGAMHRLPSMKQAQPNGAGSMHRLPSMKHAQPSGGTMNRLPSVTQAQQGTSDTRDSFNIAVVSLEASREELSATCGRLAQELTKYATARKSRPKHCTVHIPTITERWGHLQSLLRTYEQSVCPPLDVAQLLRKIDDAHTSFDLIGTETADAEARFAAAPVDAVESWSHMLSQLACEVRANDMMGRRDNFAVEQAVEFCEIITECAKRPSEAGIDSAALLRLCQSFQTFRERNSDVCINKDCAVDMEEWERMLKVYDGGNLQSHTKTQDFRNELYKLLPNLEACKNTLLLTMPTGQCDEHWYSILRGLEPSTHDIERKVETVSRSLVSLRKASDPVKMLQTLSTLLVLRRATKPFVAPALDHAKDVIHSGIRDLLPLVFEARKVRGTSGGRPLPPPATSSLGTSDLAYGSLSMVHTISGTSLAPPVGAESLLGDAASRVIYHSFFTDADAQFKDLFRSPSDKRIYRIEYCSNCQIFIECNREFLPKNCPFDSCMVEIFYNPGGNHFGSLWMFFQMLRNLKIRRVQVYMTIVMLDNGELVRVDNTEWLRVARPRREPLCKPFEFRATSFDTIPESPWPFYLSNQVRRHNQQNTVAASAPPNNAE